MSFLHPRELQPTSSRPPDKASLPVAFGMRRTPQTRTMVLDLCPVSNGQPTTRHPECQPGYSGERPAVVSVELGQDPRRDGNPAQQFPAGQIAVSAVNVGARALKVTVTVNPHSPTDVAAGVYRSTFVVLRDGDSQDIVPELVIALDSRDGQATARAVAALFLGAVLGAAAKWFNDNISPLAPIRRRSKTIIHDLTRWYPGLPEDAASTFEDVRDLRVSDQATFDERFAKLNDQRGDLRSFANEQFEGTALLDAIERDHGGEPGVGDVVACARLALQDLCLRTWPWEKPQDEVASARLASTRIRQLSTALRHGGTEAAATVDAIRNIGADWFSTTVAAAAAAPHDAGEHATGATESVDMDLHLRMEPQERDAELRRNRNTRSALVDVAPVIGMGLLVLVSVFIGYTTQYLGDNDFSGSFGDYLALVGWALGLQITGVTVVQLFGRLTPTGTVPSPS
jgi:hypothetical protein